MVVRLPKRGNRKRASDLTRRSWIGGRLVRRQFDTGFRRGLLRNQAMALVIQNPVNVDSTLVRRQRALSKTYGAPISFCVDLAGEKGGS